MRVHNEDELRAFGEDLGRYRALAAPVRFRRELRRALLTREIAPVMRSPFARLAPALAVAVILLALVSAGGAAAASSLPGDPAFVLKRGVEQLQLAFATTSASRVWILVEQSDRRLSELQEVVGQHPASAPAAAREYAAAVAALVDAVERLASAAPSEQRDAALAGAASASETHAAVLAALLERVPDEAKPGIQQAIEAQDDLHHKSKNEPRPAPSTEPSHPAPARPSPSAGRR